MNISNKSSHKVNFLFDLREGEYNLIMSSKMKIFRFPALLLIAILLIVYLLTHTRKPQAPGEARNATTSEQKIPLPKSATKEQLRSSKESNYLDSVEQEVLSQVDVESQELYEVSIKGYVYDPKSQPLKDARVSLEMDDTDGFEGTIVYTDEHGFFEINGEFLKGKYTLTIQHLNYKNAHNPVEINSNRDEVKHTMLENYGR